MLPSGLWGYSGVCADLGLSCLKDAQKLWFCCFYLCYNALWKQHLKRGF